MAIQTIIPNQNATWDDIRDTLNSCGGNVTQEGYTAFTESAKINPFSKYKPVYHNSIAKLTEAQLKSTNYGFNNLAMTTVNPGRIGENVAWDYLLPDGSENAPYRLTDFEGYFAMATPPITVEIPEKVYLNDPGNSIISVDATTFSHPSCLKVTDIFHKYLDYYVGVLCHNPNSSPGSGYYYVTSKTRLRDFVAEAFDFPMSGYWSAGSTINVYAVLSSVSFQGSLSDMPLLEEIEMFYLPYYGPKEVIVENRDMTEYLSVDNVSFTWDHLKRYYPTLNGYKILDFSFNFNTSQALNSYLYAKLDLKFESLRGGKLISIFLKDIGIDKGLTSRKHTIDLSNQSVDLESLLHGHVWWITIHNRGTPDASGYKKLFEGLWDFTEGYNGWWTDGSYHNVDVDHPAG